MKKRSLYQILATLLLTVTPLSAWAATCITSSPHPLTATECSYQANEHSYLGFNINDPEYSRFSNVQTVQIGPDEHTSFDSVFAGIAVDPPGAPGTQIPFTLMGPVTAVMRNKSTTDTTGTFDTEILSMSLSGTVGPIPIQVRQNPTLLSLGQTTITDLGGGLWQIDSFFDIFTELSVDGGGNWAPSLEASRMVLQPVPIPAAAWLFGSGLLGLVGMARRKQSV